MQWQDNTRTNAPNTKHASDDEYEYVIPLWHAALLTLQLAQLVLLIILIAR